MRNKYHIIFNLFLSFFALISVQTQAQAQETQKLAPNNIPVPWYSQKITGCPYSHCSLASSLMVFDYFKGMTTDTQRTAQDAEKKLIEYQRNYFLKKRAPFRRRTTIGMGPQEGRVLEEGRAYPDNFGKWNHVVTVWDNTLPEGQLKMYVNGELFFSKTNDVKNDAGVLQNYMPNTRNQNMWAFQEPTDNSRCMTGFIKKFRMWSTAKSANEVKTLMNSDVTGTESGLVCAWDFTTVVEDVTNIPDKTGKHVAKIVGNYKWFKVEN